MRSPRASTRSPKLQLKPAPYRAQDLNAEGHCCGDARRDARRRLDGVELIPRKPPEPVGSGSDREVQRAGDGTERYFHTAGGRFGQLYDCKQQLALIDKVVAEIAALEAKLAPTA